MVCVLCVLCVLCVCVCVCVCVRVSLIKVRIMFPALSTAKYLGTVGETWCTSPELASCIARYSLPSFVFRSSAFHNMSPIWATCHKSLSQGPRSGHLDVAMHRCMLRLFCFSITFSFFLPLLVQSMSVQFGRPELAVPFFNQF